MRNLKTTSYVQMDQLEKLKLISKVTGIPVSELIRMGINMLLKNYVTALEHVTNLQGEG